MQDTVGKMHQIFNLHLIINTSQKDNKTYGLRLMLLTASTPTIAGVIVAQNLDPCRLIIIHKTFTYLKILKFELQKN